MNPKLNATDQAIAKYLPYLKEAQRKLFHVLIVFFVAGLLGFIYYQKIINAIMRIFQLEGINLVLTSPYQFINLAVSCGLLTGLIFSLPLLGWHLIYFLKPALKEREIKLLKWLYPLSLILFILGFLFGAWIIQLIIKLYAQVSLEFSLGNIWDLGNFLSQIITMGTLMALVFQMPIVLSSLIRLRVLTVSHLKQSRKYIYPAIIIGVALLPPTDIISLIVLSVPPLLLFELTLLFNQDYV